MSSLQTQTNVPNQSVDVIINFMNQKSITIFLLLCLLSISQSRWTQEKAKTWYESYKWGAGVNYIPAYAVNPIQMWQNFDINAINQELIWAKDIGYSYLRVFLHISPFMKRPRQFLSDVFSFVSLAKSRGLYVIPVLFDDCWKPLWKDGRQPEPIKGLHNSQWVQCPGDVQIQQAIIRQYVIEVIKTFRNSDTVVFWDLYNELGGFDNLEKHLELCKKVFEWARSVSPIQPLTSGWWSDEDEWKNINEFILNQSDIVTFHAYCDVNCTFEKIVPLLQLNRPIICTEYMARTRNSTFEQLLPFFKKMNIWAINWGFVFGKTQTYYPWTSKQGAEVPQIWFHDVVHPDGRPYDPEQTDLIRELSKNDEKGLSLD